MLSSVMETRLLTYSGPKFIRELNPGSSVITYGELNPTATVQRVIYREPTKIFRIGYSDGRSQNISIDDTIYLGNKHCESMIKFLKEDLELEPRFFRLNIKHDVKKKIGDIELSLYHHKAVNDPQIPDPYTAGALLIYGDYTSPYINLSGDIVDHYETGYGNTVTTNTIIDNICHKYQFELGSIMGSKAIYFKIPGSADDEFVTWDQMFNCHHEHSLEGQIRLIGDIVYRYLSIQERWKFIRGVFDTGYSFSSFPSRIAIGHIDENMLRIVQLVLAGMGVYSRIAYDPVLPGNLQYSLTVENGLQTYPGLFYNIDNIECAINNDNQILYDEERFHLKITDITLLGEYPLPYLIMNKKLSEKSYELIRTYNNLPMVASTL